MNSKYLFARKGMALIILVAGPSSRLGGSAGLPPTPYTAPAKQVAQRILDSKTTLTNLDQELGGLRQDLAKVIVLNSKSNYEGINNAIQVAKELDPLIKEYRAIENKDLGAAAENFAKQTITVLINVLELTQPKAAAMLKVAKGGTDLTIVLGKIGVNRYIASKVSENISTDLGALNRLIAKDKAYRESQAQDGTAFYDFRNDPVIKELDDALANFPIHLEPIPEIQRPNTDQAEIDKALNENMIRLLGPDNPYLPDLLIHTPPAADDGQPDLNSRIKRLRQELALADQDLGLAEHQLELQRSRARQMNNPRSYLCQSGPCTLSEWQRESASFVSPRNYQCKTGPCTLEEWMNSTKGQSVDQTASSRGQGTVKQDCSSLRSRASSLWQTAFSSCQATPWSPGQSLASDPQCSADLNALSTTWDQLCSCNGALVHDRTVNVPEMKLIISNVRAGIQAAPKFQDCK